MRWSVPGPIARLIARIGDLDRAVLLVGLALISAVLAFLKVADLVNQGTSQAFDEWLIRSLRDPADPSDPIGPPALAEMARDLTALGGFTVLGLLTAAVGGYLWLSGRPHAVGLLLASVVGGGLLSDSLKRLFDRPRPALVPHLSYVTSSSFPSGHSMVATCTYLTLAALVAGVTSAPWARHYAFTLAMLASLLVGLSRVFLGVHYPTDVLGGWMVGIAWALVCLLVSHRLRAQGLVEGPDPEAPPPATEAQRPA